MLLDQCCPSSPLFLREEEGHPYVSILGAARRKAIVQNLTIGSIGITFIYGMLDSSTPNKKLSTPTHYLPPDQPPPPPIALRVVPSWRFIRHLRIGT